MAQRHAERSATGPSGDAEEATPAVDLRSLTRVFAMPSGDSVRAVDSVDLSVRPGEFFTLLGPSGSGKTTILRCVAGLERPDSGEIRINGTPVAGPNTFVPSQHREIGMVFQSYAIWPHLSVFENVAFPLRHLPRRERPNSAAITRAVAEALDVVGLSGQSERSSTRLSGGQQQRVAIARAIVGRPQVLLLDEPLSNLDAVLRAGMRQELRRLTKELGITALYVTHDQTEALEMSDRIAVVHAGRILQCAPPVEIYRSPESPFVAEFVGSANRLDGTVTEIIRGTDLVRVSTDVGEMDVTARAGLVAGDEVQVVIRPESLHPAPTTEDDSYNYLEVRVESVGFAGSHTNVIGRCGETEIRAEVHQHDETPVGTQARFRFRPQWCTAVRRTVPAPQD